jgi:hypothetical protein
VKLLPVGLLKTRLPWARRIAASIFVVVVFPFVPVTTMIPSVRPDSACARNWGSIRSATSPGIAEPPPRTRAAARAVFPATIAAVVLSTCQTLTVSTLATLRGNHRVASIAEPCNHLVA